MPTSLWQMMVEKFDKFDVIHQKFFPRSNLLYYITILTKAAINFSKF